MFVALAKALPHIAPVAYLGMSLVILLVAGALAGAKYTDKR